jgi:hypothetical protein
MYDKASSFIDVASETAGMLVEEMTAANRRALTYFSSLTEIFRSAPAAETEAMVPAAAKRLEAVMALNAKELETSLRTGAEVVEKLLAQSKKLQQAAF